MQNKRTDGNIGNENNLMRKLLKITVSKYGKMLGMMKLL